MRVKIDKVMISDFLQMEHSSRPWENQYEIPDVLLHKYCKNQREMKQIFQEIEKEIKEK
jgi:hypothetical protein